MNNGVCLDCPNGKYSLFANMTECLECPENTVCVGGSSIKVKPGFWRENLQSDIIFECLKGESCSGGEEENTCALGYTGMLCHECIMDDTMKYARSGKHGCTECGNDGMQIIQIIGILIAVLIFLIILIS